MKFIKKAFLLWVIYIVFTIYYHNITIYHRGSWGLWFTSEVLLLTGYIWTFFPIMINVGILKLFSLKLNEKIYNSRKIIIYLAIMMSCVGSIEVLIFSPIFEIVNQPGLRTLVPRLYFIVLVFVMYYFWEYRFEILSGSFLVLNLMKWTRLNVIEGKDFMDRFFLNNFGVQIDNFFKGIIVLSFLAIYLAVLIYLRKKGVYDYRDRQEIWREKAGKGLYARQKAS